MREKIKKLFLCYLAIHALISCSPNKYSTLTHIGVIKTDCTAGLDILAKNDTIVIFDFYGLPNLIHVYLGKNGKKAFDVGKRGTGKDNLSLIDNMDFYDNHNLLLFDSSLGKIVKLELSNKKPMEMHVLSNNLANRSEIYCINRIGHYYICTGTFNKDKFMVVNAETMKSTGFFGAYSNKPNSKISDFVHARASFGKTVCYQKDSLLVNISYISGIITFYKFSNERPVLLKEVIISPFNYIIRGESYSNQGVMGFLSLSITPKYVYALYSGEKKKGNSIKATGKTIYIFDHKGNFKRKFKLDAPSIGMAVDSNDSKLYSLVQNGKTDVYIYNNQLVN
ncbi:MAG: TolB-like 6-bladed beta-propeller domain-containing protein [Prevotella sp.]|jgi:hypothetical protein|nr:TolB-like 6-bladed beta-propeller domain-containing protein [Prevotella sp.]